MCCEKGWMRAVATSSCAFSHRRAGMTRSWTGCARAIFSRCCGTRVRLGGFKYSLENEKSLDIGIFLNGLPVFTTELKNPVSGQNVSHAIAQYQQRRDPKEPLFRLGRCLAHFAIDTEQVFMTAALDGKRTRFFAFNQGCDGGAGNPPSRTGIATAYLWREVWSQESILDLVRRFVQLVDQLDDKGRPTGKKIQIFPRYHQLGCVREQTAHAGEHGPGFSYLNQHSAGSGKSIEIATLANSLATLHDAQGKAVFNTVIVLSDRQVIDSQLQTELTRFTQTPGMLENIDRTSRQLKAALEDGKKIIVSTIQKFSVIVEDMVSLKANTFAQFQPYYDRIKLTKEVEPDKLYDIRTELEEFGIYTPAAIDAFCEVFYHKGSKEAKIAKLHALTDPLIAQFRQMDENDRKNFKSLMRDYVKLYGFLSQLIPFRDARLEIKFYKKVQDDQEIAKELFDRLFERYLASKR